MANSKKYDRRLIDAETFYQAEYRNFKDICDFLDISPNTLRRLIRNGDVQTIQIHGIKRVSTSSVRKLVSKSNKPTPFGKD